MSDIQRPTPKPKERSDLRPVSTVSPTRRSTVDEYNSLSDEFNRLAPPSSSSSSSGLAKEGLAIGIDLGTTNSVAAFYNNDKFEVIASRQGGNLVPSYVYLEDDSGKVIIVGKEAKEMVVADPQNTVYEAKRLIGMKFDDSVVQRDKSRWPFEIVNAGSGNQPKIRLGQKLYTPQQISAHVLTELKQNAETQLGAPVQNAVITVPAYFNDSQRAATVEAGELAGLNVLRIISEPTASVLAYSLQKAGSGVSQNILVFDLGGGTFDVSIVAASREAVSVIAVGGDTHLGGSDFDRNLVNYCLSEFTSETGLTVPMATDIGSSSRLEKDENMRMRNLSKMERLRDQCEQCKIRLSGLKTSNVYNEYFYEGRTLQVPVSRETFVSVNRHLFSRCMTIMNEVRVDSKLAWDEIDGILLVGGSTRIPAIKDMIRLYYAGPILENVDKDEVVARGAAVQADILMGNNVLDVADITPLSLGVENHGGDMAIYIPKLTRIPFSAKGYRTAVNEGQTSCTFKIYQGENRMAVDNCFLDKFSVFNVPPTPKGARMFQFFMDIDSNGILKVEAVAVADKDKKNSIQIIRSSSKVKE